MNKKKLYIYTIGCQMNVYDSEIFVRMLEPEGYIHTGTPEEADLIIVNTCTVRKKAEEKAFSFLGRTRKLKKKNPELAVAIGGCVAQQEGERIIARIPSVDIVFGTGAVSRLPSLVKQFDDTGEKIVDTEIEGGIAEIMPQKNGRQKQSVSRFVTVMRGCNNFCTYCIVPYVRGREKSRDPENIIREITALVESGAREITLLGQNVNSYGLNETICSFPELLKKVSNIDGLERIRFATSHPKDMSDELIAAYGEIEKLCNHIHLPVQSGSDRILKKMNRKYTGKIYMSRIERLRDIRPDIAVTSDIIVGFPGETDEDFRQTLDLVERVGYDGLFAFKYSDRPKTPAVAFKNKVSEEVKRERLQELLALEKRLSRMKNSGYTGKTVEILVEGNSKRPGRDGNLQWTGRTSSNKVVNFAADPASEKLTGQILKVKIEESLEHSLWGRLKEE